MRKHQLLSWLVIVALLIGVLPVSALPFEPVQSDNLLAPQDVSVIMLDGVRDADYMKIATDPSGDLGPCCWNGINWTDLTNLYVAADATNLYVYVESPAYDYTVSAGQIGLAIDVDGKPNSGGTIDPWNNAIAFSYKNVDGAATARPVLPDYVIRGNVINNLGGGDAGNGWTELRHWTGGSWAGGGTNWGGITGSNLIGTHIAYSNTQGIEFAIPLADIGNPDPANVHLEFFATQGGGTKGAYDTLPSDDQATGWDDATTENNLVSVPVAIDPASDSWPGNAWFGVAWTDMTRLHIWVDHDNLHIFAPMSAYSTTASTGQIGFAIDTKPGGGSSDPWGNGITYAYTTTWQNLGHTPVVTTTTIQPDYMIRGNIFSSGDNGWTEFRTWNGSDWNTGGGTDWGGIGNTGQPARPGSHVAWSNGDGLRLTIPLNQLNVLPGDTLNLEFFGTQGGGTKGAYDTVPSDDQATGWDTPTIQKVFASYTVPDIPRPVASHDGTIWTDGLYHNTRDDAYRVPFGAIPTGTPVTLRFRAYHNDLTGVRLRMSDSVSSTLQSYPMNLVATDGTYDYYEYTVPTDHATIYWYSFVAMDTPAAVFYGDEANWWNAPWTKDGAGTPTTDPAQLSAFQLTVYQPDYTTPDWLRNGTIYQIFPDRFRNGNPANDLPGGSFFYGNDERWGPGSIYTGTIAHTTWNEQIYDPRSNPTYLGAYSNQFYGGDLQGIMDKINAGYFNDLGVTVLYLNPIFKSPSNHKYDTTDYTQIDPAFGTNQDFADLTQAAQAHGIHVVLDGVFNHSSSDSYYFDKYSRWNAAGGATPIGLNDGSGAYESITSTYFSWYFFNPWPTGYTAWAGYMSLPKLNSPNPLVRSFIYSGTNPIATRWIMSGSQQLASGWRFDVAGDVDSGYSNDPTNGYWIGFRNAVRSVYSQTAMISEEWGNASQYLLGNQMDSTMNYRFRNALIGYVRDTGWSDTNTTLPHETASQFFETMRTMQEDYPAPAWYAMMNLVGSHDTNRLRFVIKESSDVTGTVDARQKLTALAQFSLPGAPTVYYADEVGAGADGVPCSTGSPSTCGDPYNRLPFPWNDTPGYYLQETGILTSYVTLGNARQTNPALRTGSLDLLLADDTNNTLAYGRKLGSNVAIAVFNRQATSQQVVVNLSGYLAADTALTDVLTGNTYTPTVVGVDVPLTLTLSGNTGALLITNAASAAPDAPFVSTPGEGNGEVVLNWTDTGVGYNVYRSLVSGGGYTRVATNTLTTTFTDTTVANGTLYYYVVTALDAGLQESVYSNEVDARPHITIDWAGNLLPDSIVHTIGLTPTEPITAQVYISGVTNLTGQGAGVIAQIGYGPTGTAPSSWSAWSPAVYAGDVGNNDVYSGTLTPEVLGTLQYLARFSTTNGNDWVYAGLSGPIGDPDQSTIDAGVLMVNPSSDTTPPDAPVLSLASWNVDSLTLAWTAPAATDVYAYDLYRSSATEPSDVVARIMSPTLSYTDYTVFTGVPYTYTVVALDTSFNPSVPSNAVPGMAEQRLVEVTFNVTVPSFTPAGSTICIPGDNAKIMGSAWDPSTLPMTQVDATHWTRQITVTDGTQLQYKYTRCSSWNVVEWWGDIVGTNNRHITLNYGINGQMVISDTVYNWRDPIVLDKSPLPGATSVQNNTVITASWSRPLNPTSLPGNFTLAAASGPVAGATGFISSTAGYVSVFTPTGLLLGGAYTATLGTGITGSDNDGAGLQQAQAWGFMVDPVSVSFVTPTNNQVFTATNGTSVQAPIEITTTNFAIPTDGHWHLWVDGNMVSMVFGYTATQTLLVGSHVITAELVNPSHQPLGLVATVNVTVNPVSIAFVSPTNGQVFTATNGTSVEVPLVITTTNFAIPTDGHWHLWVDGSMVSMVFGYTATQTLLVGSHTITAELVNPSHQPLGPVATVNLTVNSVGIAFVSPTNGQVFAATNGTSADVSLVVTTTNFAIPGDGHWHLWIDGNMVNMIYGYTTMQTLLVGSHVISAELVTPSHQPLGPVATVAITVSPVSIAFVSPTNGQVFTAMNGASVNVPLVVTTTNFAIPTDGQWQLWLDGASIRSVTGYTTTQTLLAGTHILSAELRSLTNQPLGVVATVNVTVNPVSVAFVTPTNNQVFTATNGTSVNVPIQITTTNFVIPTDGNWHLWIDGLDKGSVASTITTTALLAGAHIITAELRSSANIPLGPVATVNVVVNVAGVSFVTPTNGHIFTATNNISLSVPLIITTTNFAIPADGRWQLWVDGSLISTVAGYTTTQTLLVGSHVISAALVNPAQQPLGPVATVTIQVHKIRPYATYLPLVQR